MRDSSPQTIIVFEGLDGAGKTTQTNLLDQALRNRGFTVAMTGVFRTAYGGDLRSWFMDPERMSRATLRTQVFLLASAMNQALEEMEASTASVLIVDRFVYTTMAYHGGGLGLGITEVRKIYAPILRRFRPALVVVLDLPANLVQTRICRPRDRIENRDLAFFERVHRAYTEIASIVSNAVEIDARRPVTQVHEDVLSLVLKRLIPSVTREE